MRMSQVVDTNAFEAGALRDEAPWTVEIVARLFRIVAHDHVQTVTRQLGENGEGRGIEHDGRAAGLTVREQQQSSLDVNVFPFQAKNFTQACSGKNKKPQCRRGVRADIGEPYLRNVFRRRLLLIDDPRGTGSLRL